MMVKVLILIAMICLSSSLNAMEEQQYSILRAQGSVIARDCRSQSEFGKLVHNYIRMLVLGGDNRIDNLDRLSLKEWVKLLLEDAPMTLDEAQRYSSTGHIYQRDDKVPFASVNVASKYGALLGSILGCVVAPVTSPDPVFSISILPLYAIMGRLFMNHYYRRCVERRERRATMIQVCSLWQNICNQAVYLQERPLELNNFRLSLLRCLPVLAMPAEQADEAV